MSDQLPALRDENALITPDRWREHVLPRRGGLTPVPEATPQASICDEVRTNLSAARPIIDAVLDDPASNRGLVEAARAYLRGDLDPLGAAVVATVETVARQQSRFGTDADWADFLVAEHGVAFAACAFAELDGIWADCDTEMSKDKPRKVQHDGWWDTGYAHWATGPAGRRMRALLAAAGDDDHAEAVERLAEHRRKWLQRLVVCFLVPSWQDWVDECCAAPPKRGDWCADGAKLLWSSIETVEQIERLGDWARFGDGEHHQYGDGERHPSVIYTVIDGAGVAAAPALARSLNDATEAKDRRLLLEALGVLPSDEAFLLMGERLDQRNVLPAMAEMIERFPVRALRVLAELSVGTSKRARLAAGLLNAHLLARPDLAAEALPGLGDDVKAAIQAVEETRVAEAPASDVPKALLKGGTKGAPDWAAPTAMPQVLLKGRERALPAAATGHLIEALAKASPRREPGVGVKTALDALDPGSLAEFGWALFERWRICGESTRIGWALSQLYWTGDDETARRLGGMARSWPGQDGIKLPLNGLDVLAAIGTDVAVMQLHLVSEKARPKRLKKKALQLLDQVAEERGLTLEQLADRMVPDFGLDADGSMTLDYGPRRFVVGFDEQLKPQVTDDKGKIRKALPKPGAKDDQELAPAAYRAFTGLKKDVRTVAADQIRRMERAMSEQRRWEAREFQSLFVEHPLLWHIVKRLVWVHEEGGKATALRVAEDRTLADVHDEILTLPETGNVRIAHPLHLGETVGAWGEGFADYEILQPFQQLGRPIDAFTEEERGGNRLSRVEDITVSTGKVLGLERQGWVRGTPQDAGVQCWMTRDVPGGRTITLEVSPGFPVMSPGEWAEQTLGTVWITESPDSYWRDSQARFSELDEVTASELLLTLSTLAEPAQ
ncbi:DUF4132 domain-containing protein [Actinomadura alba]|uniref:DUF4132 domain-containing protein n=1 Tax=Actinomadura alba TaxID=406431 RepID=A0ABR7LME1_9ACTN|nr:DUF4132 domain-containing protein [Actinomadura alba]MBC6465983.1 DUF4132 domain-containing protein [Actinomadura alba]